MRAYAKSVAEPLTDEQLDALDAEIAHDMAVARALNDQLIEKVRRYRAEVARRQQSGTVHPLPRRDEDEAGE